MKKTAALILAAALALALCACGQQGTQETPQETEKIVTVEVPVEVEKIVEVPVEVEKIVEVPVEVEKIVEVPVEVEKIVEVPVEVKVTDTVEVPRTYTARERIEMMGVEIPDDFAGDYENGTVIYLFARNSYSVLRSSPDNTDDSNAIAYIRYYFETELDKSDPTAWVSHRVAVGQSAVSYGTYGDYSLVLWNGRYGWIKNSGISLTQVITGGQYTETIRK